MPTYTSNLPKEVLDHLTAVSQALKVSRNKIVRHALTFYLEQIERKMYVQSYKMIADDDEVLLIAEERIEDYLTAPMDWDEKS